MDSLFLKGGIKTCIINFFRFHYFFFPNHEFKEVPSQKHRNREGLRLEGASWDQVAFLLVSPYLLMLVCYIVQGVVLFFQEQFLY